MRRLAYWQWTAVGIAVAILAIQGTIGWEQAAKAGVPAARVTGKVLWWLWPLLIVGLAIWRDGPISRWLVRIFEHARRRDLFVPFFLGLPLLAGLVVASVFILPDALVPEGTAASTERLAELRNDVRGTLIQAAGGLLLVFGAVATWRGLHINREGQITERYTRAVDQLGAVDDNGKEKVDVQLGGIYALERIAHDSQPDQPTIVEVLTAFVRQRATRGGLPRRVLPTTLQGRQPTVQAAMRVLGRMPRPANIRLELPNVDLRNADLRKSNLAGADLSDADLAGANLGNAILAGANLGNAILTGAILWFTTLPDAVLDGANLTDATLVAADLTGVQADHRTSWPAGFDPAANGVTIDE